MTNEVKDTTKVEANAEETQRQIADLQQQIKVIAAESDAFLASAEMRHLRPYAVSPMMLKDRSHGAM